MNLDALATRLAEGKGLLGRVLTDDQMGDQLAASLASLSNILRKADDPTAGALGAVLADQDLRNDLKLVVANLRSVTDKLDNGKGLLSLLINDEDMGIRMRRILNQVSRALEDVRESAPIGNFIQVLLGTF
jgi:hypothetical protein